MAGIFSFVLTTAKLVIISIRGENMNPVSIVNRVIKTTEGINNFHRLEDIINKAQAMNFDAIPLEQLKGDLARSGHPVKQAMALDPEHRRIFFTDSDGSHLFAEFGNADEGYKIKSIGNQSTIAKEYDVIDLIPSTESHNPGESVVTVHNEEELEYEEPQFIPRANPGQKPDEDLDDTEESVNESLESRESKDSIDMNIDKQSVIKELLKLAEEEKECT